MAKENTDKNQKTLHFYQNNWWKQGLIWGMFMFAIMVFVFPYYEEEEITIKSILLGIPIWTLAGLGYGYFMKRYYEWIARKK